MNIKDLISLMNDVRKRIYSFAHQNEIEADIIIKLYNEALENMNTFFYSVIEEVAKLKNESSNEVEEKFNKYYSNSWN